MSEQCQHIKSNGEQCRGRAIWASEPPRCAVHRQDGEPRAPLFPKGHSYGELGGLKHGFFGMRPRPGPDSLEDETAACLVIHQRLSALIASQPADLYLVYLYRLYGRILHQLLKKLDQYHRETGEHPDRLLEQASNAGVARIQAKLAAQLAQREADLRPDYPRTTKRSPRYWLVYDFIVAYIERHSVGPTRQEIMQACGLPSKGRPLAYWLDQLERDGLISRKLGQPRSIRLGPRLPLCEDEAGAPPPCSCEGV